MSGVPLAFIFVTATSFAGVVTVVVLLTIAGPLAGFTTSFATVFCAVAVGFVVFNFVFSLTGVVCAKAAALITSDAIAANNNRFILFCICLFKTNLYCRLICKAVVNAVLSTKLSKQLLQIFILKGMCAQT